MSQLHHSKQIPHAELLRIDPTVTFALQCQSVLGSLSVFLYWRTYFLATISYVGLLHAAKQLFLYSLWATRFGSFHGAVASVKMATYVWDSKSVQMLRKKLFYEFALFILGMGNHMILMLFWPGWILLVGTWAIWYTYG